MTPVRPHPSDTIRLITRRLMPLLMLLYLIAYLDRSNISVAALQMNADLGLSSKMYGLGAGLFYVTYCIFEVPSNVILVRVGPRRWIARIMLTWGVIACGMAFIRNAGQLYTMRLLLGAAEAGFTPGIIYYLSCWFPGQYRAGAMSLFYLAAVLASVVGLPVSGALLGLNGQFGLAGWRWLYLVEGLPAIGLGVFVLKHLPNRPADARWLSAEQRGWLEMALAAPAMPADHKQDFRKLWSDTKIWLLGLFWLLQAFGTTGITLFLPQMVKALSDRSDFVVTLYSALPFMLAGGLMYLNGRHSDISGERRLHLGIPLLLSGCLLVATLLVQAPLTRYALLALSVAFNWAATPVFWAVTTQYLAGGVAAAAAIGLINALANLTGVGLPPLVGYLKDQTRSYAAALAIVAGALVVGGWLGLLLGRNSRHPAALVREQPLHS